jgi:hypothetical protein
MGYIGEVVLRVDLHRPDEKLGEIPAEPAGADLPGLAADLPGDPVAAGTPGR